MGRDFPWSRPKKCPCCGNWKVWGHGFASTIFQGFDDPLLLKRYRCPSCGCIIKLRPLSHFSRFQSSKHTIRSALVYRITKDRWPPGSAGSRQRHWLCNLKRQMKAHLTEEWRDGLATAFDYLMRSWRKRKAAKGKVRPKMAYTPFGQNQCQQRDDTTMDKALSKNWK